MPRLSGKREVVTGWLYDAAVLSGTITEVTYFQSPKGQAGTGIATKTFVDTNVEAGAGFLAGVKAFVIKSMLYKIEDCQPSDDLCTIISQGFGVLKISDKPYPSPFPVWLITGGPGLFDNVRGPAAAPDFRGTVGPGNIANVLKLHSMLPVPINTLEPFSFDFQWPGGITISSGTSIKTWIVLFGFLKRQVA